jgi:hypothetical protein
MNSIRFSTARPASHHFPHHAHCATRPALGMKKVDRSSQDSGPSFPRVGLRVCRPATSAFDPVFEPRMRGDFCEACPWTYVANQWTNAGAFDSTGYFRYNPSRQLTTMPLNNLWWHFGDVAQWQSRGLISPWLAVQIGPSPPSKNALPVVGARSSFETKTGANASAIYPPWLPQFAPHASQSSADSDQYPAQPPSPRPLR